MLEYHAHIAVLRQVRAALGSTFAGDPAKAAQIAALVADAQAEPDSADLGAIIDLLVEAADSDGVELDLLQQAADLWTRGLTLYDQLTAIRKGLEGALVDPTAPGALAVAATAVSQLGGLQTAALSISADAQALHAAIDPLPHLKPHPRQSDAPSKAWGWRDAFLGRRTEAFVAALLHDAKTPRARSFAFGALSSYSGNITGSAYLGGVVGGPRRLHRYRDRLARNTVGAWLQGQLATPTCGALSRAVGFRVPGGGYGLPADIAAALGRAAKTAWPSRAAPNWNLGVARTLQHLQLLQVFQRPDLPDPPPPDLASAGGVTGGLTALSDPTFNVPNGTIDTDGNVSGGVGQVTTADSKSTGGMICLAILAVLITIGIALLIYCIGQWSTGNKCHPDDFFNTAQGSQAPDPRDPTEIGQQQLTAMSDPSAAGHIAQELFALQMMLWQGFDASASYLAVTGLIYPDDLLLASPLYAQFLSTPVRATWPHREAPSAAASYQFDPTSPAEQPAMASPFAFQESPLAFAGPWSPLQTQAATVVAHAVMQQVLAKGRDLQNQDLDADRGYRHPCWALAPGASIHDPVLAVEVLAYGAE